MSFQLRADETLADGLRRVTVWEVDSAIERLDNRANDRDVAVHEARKSFKKIRAVLRLLRDQPDTDVYRTENRRYRDLGRRLSRHRDSYVLIETADRLAGCSSDLLTAAVLSGIADSLREQASRTARDGDPTASDLEAAASEVAAALRTARPTVAHWPIGEGFEAVAPGLKRTYRQGRKALRLARDLPDVKRLHEWRKRVKNLWYHMRLLSGAWPESLEGVATALESLAELLGEDHDLALLRETLERPPRIADPDERDAIFRLIESRRRTLQAEAWPIGERVYLERPRRFTERLAGYWEIWRAWPAATTSPGGASEERPRIEVLR